MSTKRRARIDTRRHWETGVTPIELRSWGIDAVRSYSTAPAAASEFDEEMPAETTVVTTGPSLAGAGRRATYVSA